MNKGIPFTVSLGVPIGVIYFLVPRKKEQRAPVLTTADARGETVQ